MIQFFNWNIKKDRLQLIYEKSQCSIKKKKVRVIIKLQIVNSFSINLKLNLFALLYVLFSDISMWIKQAVDLFRI